MINLLHSSCYLLHLKHTFYVLLFTVLPEGKIIMIMMMMMLLMMMIAMTMTMMLMMTWPEAVHLYQDPRAAHQKRRHFSILCCFPALVLRIVDF